MKPCPHCGGERLSMENGLDKGWGIDTDWAVRCQKCRTLGPVWSNRERAAVMWDARSDAEFRAALQVPHGDPRRSFPSARKAAADFWAAALHLNSSNLN